MSDTVSYDQLVKQHQHMKQIHTDLVTSRKRLQIDLKNAYAKGTPEAETQDIEDRILNLSRTETDLHRQMDRMQALIDRERRERALEAADEAIAQAREILG